MKSQKTPVVGIHNLVKEFDISGSWLDRLSFEKGRLGLTFKKTIVHAVNNVSIDIHKGETVSVVGESGCGKSTLARTVMGLYPPNSGGVYFKGERISGLDERRMKPYRRGMQMVFQDPYSSLNPRMGIGTTLSEPIRFHQPELSRAEVNEKVALVMQQVGIDPDWRSRFPHEFSGGQRQRISIARALVVDPEFIVADEPIAALDVSIQAQILNLMMDLQAERKLTYLFISHDLSVIHHISNRVVVMYLGTVCEAAPKEAIFKTPRHPYTQALLGAIPKLGKPFSHQKLTGEIPSPLNLPTGCVFHTRCPHVMNRCREQAPPLQTIDTNTQAACHLIEKG